MSNLVETTAVALAQIALATNWREGLDQTHVHKLAEQIQAGRSLPPVRLNAQFELIQGRHRLAAHQELGLAHVRADIVEYDSREEEEADAIAENIYRRKLPAAEERKAIARLVQLRTLLLEQARERVERTEDDQRDASQRTGVQRLASRREGGQPSTRRDAIRAVARETGRSERTVDRATKADSGPSESARPSRRSSEGGADDPSCPLEMPLRRLQALCLEMAGPLAEAQTLSVADEGMELALDAVSESRARLEQLIDEALRSAGGASRRTP